jgi:hypothetical protein
MTRFMITAKKGIRLFHLLTFLGLLLFSGCNKLENTTLGAELLPGTDQLKTDTMLIPVSTISFIEQDTRKAIWLITIQKIIRPMWQPTFV